MRRWYLVGMAVVGTAASLLGLRAAARPAAVTATASAPAPRSRAVPLVLPPSPRVMVFTPHPDDETLAAGGLISRLAGAGVPVHVVFITNGDGYPTAVKADFDLARPTQADYVELGELREREALAALGRLGLGRRQVSFLGFPDGGLAHLWHAHWSPSHPYTSPYTREDSPPYPDTVNPDVGYDGQDLTAVIERMLRDLRPSVVLMPHPHDTHRDHAATSYFVTEALSALQARGVLSPDLTVLTYLVHYPSWPTTRGPAFDRLLVRDDVPDTTWLETELSPDELAAKRAALAEYRSQLDVMNGFLRSFLCRNELLGKVDARLLARIASIH